MAKPRQRRTKSSTSRAAKGEAQRRRVLGNAYVDQSLANLDGFNREFYTLIHEWVWHDIWSRPGLPLKTRSLINLALLTALNRPRELLIHLRGALNNGCSVSEIKEVLMHTALYAGVPAAVDGIHTVREALIAWGTLPKPKKPKTR
ncbi:MAG: carboxymuconolactone decarboxylase family protein [Rhodospirillaceae bacterium]|nr:carboxymuconolactone decarboxylase family protein [Rhodospirillaceae bacterium]